MSIFVHLITLYGLTIGLNPTYLRTELFAENQDSCQWSTATEMIEYVFMHAMCACIVLELTVIML